MAIPSRIPICFKKNIFDAFGDKYFGQCARIINKTRVIQYTSEALEDIPARKTTKFRETKIIHAIAVAELGEEETGMEYHVIFSYSNVPFFSNSRRNEGILTFFLFKPLILL